MIATSHSLAEYKCYQESFLTVLVFDIIMVYSVYYAEFVAKTKKDKQIWYIVGVIAMILILWYVKKWNDFLTSEGVETERLSNFFYIGWSLYGLNFLNGNENFRQTGFNILDFFNKGIYSLQLDSVISKL